MFDTAMITVDPTAGDLQGTVQFELFINDTMCAGTPVLTTAVPISGPSGQLVQQGCCRSARAEPLPVIMQR